MSLTAVVMKFKATYEHSISVTNYIVITMNLKQVAKIIHISDS